MMIMLSRRCRSRRTVVIVVVVVVVIERQGTRHVMLLLLVYFVAMNHFRCRLRFEEKEESELSLFLFFVAWKKIMTMSPPTTCKKQTLDHARNPCIRRQVWIDGWIDG